MTVPVEIRSSGTPTAIGVIYPYRSEDRSMVGIAAGSRDGLDRLLDRLLTPAEARKAAAALAAYADDAEPEGAVTGGEIVMRDDQGDPAVVLRARRRHVTVTLPQGKARLSEADLRALAVRLQVLADGLAEDKRQREESGNG